jgi:hypothetical protein
MNPRWSIGLALAALLTLGVVATVQAGGERTYWRHSVGHFEKVDGNWRERTEDGTLFRFVETDRTAQFVELFDRSRNIRVRLQATNCLVKDGNGPWEKNYTGKWVK